jgi:hypothetical protein
MQGIAIGDGSSARKISLDRLRPSGKERSQANHHQGNGPAEASRE